MKGTRNNIGTPAMTVISVQSAQMKPVRNTRDTENSVAARKEIASPLPIVAFPGTITFA